MRYGLSQGGEERILNRLPALSRVGERVVRRLTDSEPGEGVPRESKSSMIMRDTTLGNERADKQGPALQVSRTSYFGMMEE